MIFHFLLPKRLISKPGPKLAPDRAMFEFLKSISARTPRATHGSDKPPVSARERAAALRHLPAFLKLI